jgi:hypothetical protein
MAKKYRTSHPPTPELSGMREFNLPSNRIQGSKDCMLCGSKTMSYKGLCKKCKWSISPERVEYLAKKRNGQVLALAQEKIWKERDRDERKD